MSAELFIAIGAIAGWALILGVGAFIGETFFEDKNDD